MQSLVSRAQQLLQQQPDAPFAVYSSVREQVLLNVPVVKPLLVCVADGCKQLGDRAEISCTAGHFVFLPGSGRINMRNIPAQSRYRALLMEFEADDFVALDAGPAVAIDQPPAGIIDELLLHSLQQYIDWSVQVPAALLSLRRQEILRLLQWQGYHGLTSLVRAPSLSQRLHQLIREQPAADHTAASLGRQLAMSEATLHRRLKAENTRLQDIKDGARLGLALHWLQTGNDAVSRIAENCGYVSPSRFSEKFRQQFGLTPSELRKTRLME